MLPKPQDTRQPPEGGTGPTPQDSRAAWIPEGSTVEWEEEPNHKAPTPDRAKALAAAKRDLLQSYIERATAAADADFKPRAITEFEETYIFSPLSYIIWPAAKVVCIVVPGGQVFVPQNKESQ